MAAQQADDIAINTVIGAGSSIRGDLHIDGFVRIDGDLNGNLDTPGRVIVGEKARIRGNISAFSAAIGGIVEGDIVTEDSIVIHPSAVVLGDVITRRLQVAESVVLNGTCISIPQEDEFRQAKSRWLDMKAIQTRTAAFQEPV